MGKKTELRVALIGNPNAGKTSLFNNLTGLNQKVGNFPGVTVERKTGYCKLESGQKVEIIDLPGTYSINPKSLDEHVVFEELVNIKEELDPDKIIVIVDETNLKRNLLLFTQIKDLGIPVILALNMVELAKKTGIEVNRARLETETGIPVVEINARHGKGIDELKRQISKESVMAFESVFRPRKYYPDLLHEIKGYLEITNTYKAYQIALHHGEVSYLTEKQKAKIKSLCEKYQFKPVEIQTTETLERYRYIDSLLEKSVKGSNQDFQTKSTKADKILTHKVWGMVIFLLILFVIFQSVFSWAIYPMEWIDAAFASLSEWVANTMPSGALNNLLADGLIPGISGVVIFVPQIALLFGLIAILEESGYMARVMYIMDRLMKRFGMSGRSVVPLVSAVACAVPAIMSARSIGNWKERMITIFVTPLMSCSARLPVYVILISLIIPSTQVWGVFNLQGLALLGMYLLGFAATLFSALLMKLLLRSKERGYFVLELPEYRMPRWKNVARDLIRKTKEFVFEAGKVIILISIILWYLASHGPGNTIEEARLNTLQHYGYSESDTNVISEVKDIIASRQLEASYAGRFGKFIEPAIRPLGYDWKIGVALISSFAAREVFVGTMATLYSIESSADENSLIKRMRAEKNVATGDAMFTVPVAVSLLIFYAFAMQCMSTFAVVYRETKGLKWPILQFIYMTSLAYLSSLVVYNLLS